MQLRSLAHLVCSARATHPPVETVTSRRNVLVGRFRSAVRANRRSRTHLLLDGRRLIADARRAGVALETLLVATSALRRGEPGLDALVASCEANRIDVVAGSDGVLAAASPLRSPSTAVALARHCPPSVDDVLACAARGCLVAPVGVQDPGNLGAIVRAADAAGAGGVVVTGTAADPFGWKAVARRHGQHLPAAGGGRGRAERPAGTGAAGRLRVLAAAPRGGRSMYDLDLTRPLLILIGGEGAGIESSVFESADAVVSIPMAGGVDSLNAGVAAAVIAYEARRQRMAV